MEIPKEYHTDRLLHQSDPSWAVPPMRDAMDSGALLSWARRSDILNLVEMVNRL